MSGARVAIAWVLSRGDDVVPLVGARRDRLREALGAADLAWIEGAAPAGGRYAEFVMANLDSGQ